MENYYGTEAEFWKQLMTKVTDQFKLLDYIKWHSSIFLPNFTWFTSLSNFYKQSILTPSLVSELSFKKKKKKKKKGSKQYMNKNKNLLTIR